MSENTTESDQLINRLTRQIAADERYYKDGDAASWNYERGVLITRDEAKLFKSLLEAKEDY